VDDSRVAGDAGTADFIVVGGGTAGCVLASRLSEDPEVAVLLLEAGTDELPAATRVPPAWPTLIGSEVDWGYQAVPQARYGARIPLPAGKGLGGSSAINGMVFLRGHRSSYDSWVAQGATGWGYDDLLPYLRRSERVMGRAVDSEIRGSAGPVTVSPASAPGALVAAFRQAALEAGYPEAPDLGGGLREGVGWLDLNIADGARQSAADTYLSPKVRARPNLRIVGDALVHRIRVRDGRAVGIEYTVGRQRWFAAALSEVVLAAGAFGSPKLLMLSGIGPGEDLRATGIEVVQDSPGVGGNLSDHPMTSIVYTGRDAVPPGTYNHSEVAVLLRSDPQVAQADLHCIFNDLVYHSPAVPGPAVGYTLLAAVMQPHSRGSVRLDGPNPETAPVIDPNYYSDSRDLDAMMSAIRQIRRIGEAGALKEWCEDEALPGATVRSDGALEDYIQRNLLTYFHYVGTCRIGTDDTAVVDTDLRVHGVHGLRVADASVMPTPPSANTAATVYGIAERAATMIASQHNSPRTAQPKR
jgi:choline dehydrogenase